MPSLTDDISQELQHKAEQKVQEKAFDISSDIAASIANSHRSVNFSFVNMNQGAFEFQEYFGENERRQVFGEIAREMVGNDFKPIIDFNFIGPLPPPEKPDFIGPPLPPFIGPPKPPDFEVYKKYDELQQKIQPKLDKLEHKMEKNQRKLDKTKAAISKEYKKIPHKKGRLIYEKGETRFNEDGIEEKHMGRLKFKDKGIMSEREYYHALHKKDVADRHATRRMDRAKERTKRLLNDDSIAEDEATEEISRRLKTAKRGARLIVQHNTKRIRQTSNHYTRLKTQVAKGEARLAKEYALKYRKNRVENGVMTSASSSAAMKRRMKKEIIKRRAAEQGNVFQRIKKHMFGMKKRAALQVIRTRRNITLITSIGSTVAVVATFLVAGFIVLYLVFSMSADVMMHSTTSNTYSDISDATAEFRRLETDLEEFLNPDTLEPLLQAENPDKQIYEYIYDLDAFGFSANTLISYLSVKYQEFNLAEVAAEIQKIFDAMYYFHYELVQEARYIKIGSHLDTSSGKMVDDCEWRDVWICYVFLDKTEMETVVESWMSAEELKQYQAYKLSTGGQPVYGGIMMEEWTNLITSPFGERIHPITGVRTFHNGVDIAIPIGTSLYTPVEGKVTTATYSDTAGYYLIITTDDGWSVKYMHMDSLAVSAGDAIKKGDFVGYSGNTGQSTGAHLHLEIRNPSDVPIDPIFIVPQAVSARTN